MYFTVWEEPAPALYRVGGCGSGKLQCVRSRLVHVTVCVCGGRFVGGVGSGTSPVGMNRLMYDTVWWWGQLCGWLGRVWGGETGVRLIHCNMWEERVHVPMLHMLSTRINMFIVCVTSAQSGDMCGRCAAQYTRCEAMSGHSDTAPHA